MTDRFSTELIQNLENAGRLGLTKARLIMGKGRAAKAAALQRLLGASQVANLGTDKKPVFVLREFYKPAEIAREAVEAKATAGVPRLFSKREISKGCAGAVLGCVDEALSALVAERRLIRLQRGKSIYFLHSASIEPPARLAAPLAAQRGGIPNGAEEDALPEEQVRQAYSAIARETGFSDVLISDLQKRSGVLLDCLKPWLIEQSRAGGVLPTRGDWSLADSEARAASLTINSEPHLRVRIRGAA